MALRNTAWTKLEPGDIVNFIYKSASKKRSARRTVLILSPDHAIRKKSTKRAKRFVVGLQLDTAITAPVTQTKLEVLFQKLGGLKIDDNAIKGDLPEFVGRAQLKEIYRDLKEVNKKYDLFRTYDRIKCLKNRVYLELKYKMIPKDTLDEFAKEMIAKYGVDETE
mgnify:FL=1